MDNPQPSSKSGHCPDMNAVHRLDGSGSLLKGVAKK